MKMSRKCGRMENELKHEMLEAKLRKKMTVRRIIEGALSLCFLIIGAVCAHLYEATKEIVYYDESFLSGQIKQEIYNEAYIPFITLGFALGFAMIGFLVGDLIMSRFETFCKNGYYVTVYRGMIGHCVYVDGELKAQLMWVGYYLETSLPDGTRMNFAFGRAWYDWCHVSFSDNSTSIEL